MSQFVEVKVAINNWNDSLEVYHQARVAGAIERYAFSEVLIGVGGGLQKRGIIFHVFFDEARKADAMLFKLTFGGEA